MALNANPQPVGGAGDDDELLPCGRSLESVWAGLADDFQSGTEEEASHRATCPHCSAALTDLRALDALVRTARDVDPPAGADALTARVMDVVRLELRPGRTLPLGGEPEDTGWIFESAAARELRAAADGLPGIRTGSCRILPLDADRGRSGDGRGPMRVRVEVACTLGALSTAADAVRDALFAAADRALGMDIREIDVRVVDVLDEDDDTVTDTGPGGNAGTDHGPEGSAG
ncbi:hypothetical protein [Streptomyces sp. NPDC055749]